MSKITQFSKTKKAKISAVSANTNRPAKSYPKRANSIVDEGLILTTGDSPWKLKQDNSNIIQRTWQKIQNFYVLHIKQEGK